MCWAFEILQAAWVPLGLAGGYRGVGAACRQCEAAVFVLAVVNFPKHGESQRREDIHLSSDREECPSNTK